MPKAKTIVAKDTKEADKPQENLCKCYIPPDKGGGESFWINKLSATRAEVRNNCLAGLCVGDIIEIIENGPSGWKNEFVRIIEKQAEPYVYGYDFPGMDKTAEFPKQVAEFFLSLEKKGIRIEGVIKGIAMISRPKSMSVKEFRENLNSGPVTFTPYKR